MASKVADQLFVRAERSARDFSLFPQRVDPAQHIEGLVSKPDIRERLRELRQLDVDDYIRQTITPSEDKSRLDGATLVKRLKGQTLRQGKDGPLYWAEVILDCEDRERRIGFVVQNRGEQNGVWMPAHHRKAVQAIRDLSQHAIPIVTIIDTPGADASADANCDNQAHSISHLIAEMAQLDVPTVGIIFGNGYSGGAIPLATTNILLSVRDGVFNTIQPQGLANIVRKYDLSWQECAKYVGVSAYELYEQGYIDGIIDYTPAEKKNLVNVRKAICSSIDWIEKTTFDFVGKSPYVFDHYRRSVDRFLEPPPELKQMQDLSALSLAQSPTNQLNVFGVAYRYLRYLGLRRKLRSVSIESYGRLSNSEIPKGDLHRRAEEERLAAFREWLEDPLELRYEEKLQKTWKEFCARSRAVEDEPGKLRRFVFGSPRRRWEQARSTLCLEFCLYLYNLWKARAPGNLLSLSAYLRGNDAVAPESDAVKTVLDVIRHADIREPFIEECQSLLIFDAVYNHIVDDLKAVAREAMDTNTISGDSVERLLNGALAKAVERLTNQQQPEPVEDEEEKSAEERLKSQFQAWMRRVADYSDRSLALKAVEDWKKHMFPRVSEPLFGIITFYFEQLLPRYFGMTGGGKKEFDGRINPRNIGMKDFWNRLNLAYRDLLLHDLMAREKRRLRLGPAAFIDRFFSDFEELNPQLMSADPVNFPGFRLSVEDALNKGVEPCGLMTGIGRFKGDGKLPLLGVAISNLQFQAGAFDMASAEKFCALLLECSIRQLPILCFISSGGMQTKEGAGALFSMPIVNDRITRFVRDQSLPVICVGFGDCTGGAQASFVTHPMVQSLYMSGTNMPFAGQIVVPSHLPCTATLSNYLSDVAGAMQGLVKHPFSEELDARLADIDPRIPLPKETVEDAVNRILRGRFASEADVERAEAEVPSDASLFQPVKRVLIHARGCAAAKLVKKVQESGAAVVLVQSDADAESALPEMLSDADTLVCIGGNTPDESYLNALSVIRIAEQEGVDALHPGIGFLSENAHFASLCRSHGINFIGPSVQSMEMMGNKSNAINTAKRLGVSVVPGSEGIVTTAQAGKRLAGQIGYPILIKAVHGGGGKGIQVVDEPDTFVDLFRQIRAEARSAFGNADVYLEKFVRSMRHVEIQILRDRRGNCRVLGLRDCSVQRNNQKVVEESGSTMLPDDLEQSLYTYAAAIADDIDYTGAGTVEFIFSLDDRAVYFMEMNTRLQVEHPVTEAVTGIDIVKAQLDIAGGASIADMKVGKNGYAMEVRLNAEFVGVGNDGQAKFSPSPGVITDMVFPEDESIVLLSCVGEGKLVSPFYDNMIIQIIAHGNDREDTINRLSAYLERVHIRGIATNLPLLRRILQDDVFRNGRYDTNYLAGLLKRVDLKAMGAESARDAGAGAEGITADALKIEGSNEMKVLAPSSGIFYLTASPNEPDLVKEGDVVDTTKQLCLLEAMKLFSPLTLRAFNTETEALYPDSDRYRIVKVVATTGQAVNTSDLLFVVEPVKQG